MNCGHAELRWRPVGDRAVEPAGVGREPHSLAAGQSGRSRSGGFSATSWEKLVERVARWRNIATEPGSGDDWYRAAGHLADSVKR